MPAADPKPLDQETGLLETISSEAEAITKVLRLPFHKQVWRGQTGDFAGSGAGSSLDFQDHRAYSPGDDPRHINWQAYARTGDYSMKLYREEVRPLIDLVFDVSNSMFYDPRKRRRSLELIYFIIHSVQHSGASLTAHLVKGSHHRTMATDALLAHAWLDHVEDFDQAPAAAPPNLGAVPIRAQAMRVLVSDLLFDSPPATTLRSLVERKGRGIIFAPFVNDEANPDWFGNYEFIDAEDQTRHPHRLEPPALKRYLSAYKNHFALWRSQSRRFDVRLARVPSEPNFMDSLRSEALTSEAVGLWT
ncbi:MAG: DUF58 domain-containing protein [Verrucomicrobiota bacterium]